MREIKYSFLSFFKTKSQIDDIMYKDYKEDIKKYTAWEEYEIGLTSKKPKYPKPKLPKNLKSDIADYIRTLKIFMGSF
jgi:hypothetical protein